MLYVSQDVGTCDTPYSELVESDCRACHGASVAERHHTLITACECEMVPDATSINRGEDVGFDVVITNNMDGQGFAHFATTVTKPDQSRFPAAGYLVGPYNILLPPAGSGGVSGHVSHVVPGDAQLGVYTYRGWVGKPGVGVFHECHFDFEVVP